LIAKDFSLSPEMTMRMFFRVTFCKNAAAAVLIAFYEAINFRFPLQLNHFAGAPGDGDLGEAGLDFLLVLGAMGGADHIQGFKHGEIVKPVKPADQGRDPAEFGCGLEYGFNPGMGAAGDNDDPAVLLDAQGMFDVF